MRVLMTILLFSFFTVCVMAQSERKHVREGNEAYFDAKLPEAIEAYEKALEENPESPEAHFNLGNAQLKSEDLEAAAGSFKTAAGLLKADSLKAQALHNLGNTYLKQKKPKEAKEAYQQSLRLNPQDSETRYNLALANKMLQQQKKEQEDQQKDQQKKDQEKKEDQQKEDQQQQDKGEDQQDQKKEGQEKESEEQKQDEQQKKDQQGKGEESDEKGEEQQGSQPQEMKEGQISKEEAERILEALKNEEQKLQERLLIQKKKGKRENLEKDW